MSYRTQKTLLISTALTSVFIANLALANTMGASDETSAKPAPVPAAATASTAPAPATQSGANSYAITAQTAGTWVFSAPPETGIKIRIDGTVVMDLQGGAEALSGGDPIRAFVSLSAGAHVIEIETADGEPLPASSVQAGPVGSPLKGLDEISAAVDTAGLQTPATDAATPAKQAEPFKRAPGIGQGTGERKAFEIGGGSSARDRAARSGQTQATNAAPETGGMGQGNAGGMSSGQMVGNSASGNGSSGSSNTTSGSSGSSAAPFVIGSGGSGGSSNTTGMGAGFNGGGTTVAGLAPGGAAGSGTGGGTSGGATGGTTGGAGTPVVIAPNTPPASADAPVTTISPLAPPASVTLTEAVQLTSGPVGDQGLVSGSGQTLFGAVMDPGSFDIVQVSLAPSGRTATVDVGPTTGQFATRIFPQDFAADGTVTVTLTGANSATTEVQAQTVSYTLQRAPGNDGIVQALSRVTYGATPDLYGRVRAMGFAAYVEEQLNPETVNDAAFEATDPESLVDILNRSGNTVLNGMTNENMAYAAYSEKQLREVMGTFWWNHFHASEKGRNMYHQAVTDRRYFRENAFANFEDLLLYSARSPLMSRFLDNDNNRRGNLNENYGREILELHTVGVNGGYDDQDVIEVSRIFTGWRYNWVNEAQSDTQGRIYEFVFEPDRHDTEDKNVDFIGLNVTGRTGEDGVQEGEELIAALSMHPTTQAYVCGKIVEKFVSDARPAAFVDICTAAWEASGGNSREILRAILLDPAFIATADYQRNKAKTPFEFAASFVRAFGLAPGEDGVGSFYDRLRRAVHEAGMNPTRFPVPTGLPEVGKAWLNSTTLVAQYKRINELASRAQRNGSDMQSEIQDAGLETAEEVAAFLLGIATADRYTLEEYEAVVAELKGADGIFEPATEDETVAFRRAIALVSVSPSFHLQ